METQLSSQSWQRWAAKTRGLFEKMRSSDCGVDDLKSYLAPPANGADISEIKKRIAPITLPSIYVAVIQGVGSKFEYNYHFDADDVVEKLGLDCVAGGGRFFDLAALPKDLAECKQWAEETWISESEEDMDIWLNALPFGAMSNGDYLGLDLRSNQDNPQVLYLSHDDESKVIAHNLSHFLEAWQRLCFIGPESWMLEPFLNEEDGTLSLQSEAMDCLQEWFKNRCINIGD